MRSERYKLPNEINSNPASKKQRDYALSLDIYLPEGSTVSDASALLARHLDDDTRASEELLTYADENSIICSPYIGNKALHNLIFDNIEGTEKSAFFCFCIYKFHHNECNENLHAHEHKDVFEKFGTQYAEDFYFTTSMEEYYGEELVAFGKSTKVLEDGTKREVYGGSIHTTAYKIAYKYLTHISGLLG